MPADDENIGRHLRSVVPYYLAGFFIVILYGFSEFFRSAVNSVFYSELLWFVAPVIIAGLATFITLRSVYFLLKFAVLKIRGQKLKGRIISILNFDKKTRHWDAGVGSGPARNHPYARLEFIDPEGQTVRFGQLIDRRYSSGQEVDIIYDSKLNFQLLDDYLLPYIHVIYLMLAVPSLLLMAFLFGTVSELI